MSIINISLSMHVIFGLVGIIASYAVFMGLLKRNLFLSFLRISSITAFLGYILSWFSGGYYYVLYYGDNVKPIIKAGDYPWAHSFFMETKEHIFLFLPVLSLVLAIIIYMFGDQLDRNQSLKNKTAMLAGAITILATLITLSGVVISGSAR